MQSIQLDIEGMHCDGCVQRVTTALKKIPGVSPETVEIGKARLQIEDGKESAILAALDKLGFEARIHKDA
jgi:copper chaperone CopZ